MRSSRGLSGLMNVSEDTFGPTDCTLAEKEVTSFALPPHTYNTSQREDNNKRQRKTYRTVSSAIDVIASQLWFRGAKFGGIGDGRCRLRPKAFPNKRNNGIPS